MRISEYIQRLELLREIHGDVEVVKYEDELGGKSLFEMSAPEVRIVCRDKVYDTPVICAASYQSDDPFTAVVV